MADPPPVPAASTPVPPPLNKMPFVIPGTGMLTLLGISFLTEFWAAVVGQGGLGPAVALLEQEVVIIFGMHGDGTLSAAGLLTVTKTNGVAFGYFATGTGADHLTGTLSPDRIAAGSLPYDKLANALGASLLGADASGPIVAIAIGDGLALTAATLSFDITTVPDGTIPYAKLEETGAAALLGADTAGPVVEIAIGYGLNLSGDTLSVANGPAVLVAALGAATAGKRAFVSDSTVVAAGNFGNVVAGTGANFCPVYADGAAWRIG